MTSQSYVNYLPLTKSLIMNENVVGSTASFGFSIFKEKMADSSPSITLSSIT